LSKLPLNYEPDIQYIIPYFNGPSMANYKFNDFKMVMN